MTLLSDIMKFLLLGCHLEEVSIVMQDIGSDIMNSSDKTVGFSKIGLKIRSLITFFTAQIHFQVNRKVKINY